MVVEVMNEGLEVASDVMLLERVRTLGVVMARDVSISAELVSDVVRDTMTEGNEEVAGGVVVTDGWIVVITALSKGSFVVITSNVTTSHASESKAQKQNMC